MSVFRNFGARRRAHVGPPDGFAYDPEQGPRLERAAQVAREKKAEAEKAVEDAKNELREHNRRREELLLQLEKAKTILATLQAHSDEATSGAPPQPMEEARRARPPEHGCCAGLIW